MSHTHTLTLMANKSHPLAYLHWSQACIKQSLTPTDYGQHFHLLTLHGTVSAVFFLPTSCILHNHWMASQPPTTPKNKTKTHTHTKQKQTINILKDHHFHHLRHCQSQYIWFSLTFWQQHSVSTHVPRSLTQMNHFLLSLSTGGVPAI